MKHRLKNAISLFLLGTFILGGCSRSSRMSEEFARRIAGADHIIASDCDRGCMMAITGQEAKNLIQAISSARGLNCPACTQPQCKIEFFQDTNLLATIPVQEQWFATADGEYIEKSGVLKALQHRLETDDAGRKTWANHIAQDVVHKPEFANLQAWSVETLQRYGSGQVRTEGEGEDRKLDVREIPAWLEAALQVAYMYMPTVYVRQSQLGQAESLVFDWHNYGLIVGPSNYTTTFQAWYVTNAAPGIYAYHIQE